MSNVCLLNFIPKTASIVNNVVVFVSYPKYTAHMDGILYVTVLIEFSSLKDGP